MKFMQSRRKEPSPTIRTQSNVIFCMLMSATVRFVQRKARGRGLAVSSFRKSQRRHTWSTYAIRASMTLFFQICSSKSSEEGKTDVTKTYLCVVHTSMHSSSSSEYQLIAQDVLARLLRSSKRYGRENRWRIAPSLSTHTHTYPQIIAIPRTSTKRSSWLPVRDVPTTNETNNKKKSIKRRNSCQIKPVCESCACTIAPRKGCQCIEAEEGRKKWSGRADVPSLQREPKFKNRANVRTTVSLSSQYLS